MMENTPVSLTMISAALLSLEMESSSMITGRDMTHRINWVGKDL